MQVVFKLSSERKKYKLEFFVNKNCPKNWQLLRFIEVTREGEGASKGEKIEIIQNPEKRKKIPTHIFFFSIAGN